MISARASGVKTAWCTLEAIANTPLMQIAAEAIMRVHGIVGRSPFSGFKVGAWNAPRPIVACRESKAFETASGDLQAVAR